MSVLNIRRLREQLKTYNSLEAFPKAQETIIDSMMEIGSWTEFMLYKEFREHCFLHWNGELETIHNDKNVYAYHVKLTADYRWEDGCGFDDSLDIYENELPSAKIGHIYDYYDEAEDIAFKYYCDWVMPREE